MAILTLKCHGKIVPTEVGRRIHNGTRDFSRTKLAMTL